MKNTTTIKLVFGLLGVATALALGSKKPFANKIVAQKDPSTGAFSYANNSFSISLNLTCQTNLLTVCTFTSTATAAFFNNPSNHFNGVGQFPANGRVNPSVLYQGTINRIYLPA